MRHDARTATQIALIVAGTLLAVIVVYLSVLLLRPGRMPPSPSAPPVSAAELHAAWQAQVRDAIAPILGTSSPSADQVTAAKDRLLSLTVAPQDRDVHLALVMALLSMERDGSGALDQLHSAYTDSQRP